MTILQPPGWPRPKGYACGVSATGTTIFVSGQIGWDEHGRFDAHDIAGQVRQALRNVAAVLAEGGARPEDVTRMTWFVTSKREYLDAQRAIGEAYRAVMGAHYPAMSVVAVAALLEDDAKVEIEATAVIERRDVHAADPGEAERSVRSNRPETGVSGNSPRMSDQRSDEKTETDERVAENQTPSPIATWDADDADPATGLPRGMHDDDASPVDPGEPLDPFRGASRRANQPDER